MISPAEQLSYMNLVTILILAVIPVRLEMPAPVLLVAQSQLQTTGKLVHILVTLMLVFF